MFGQNKIKISAATYELIKKAAEIRGASSLEEFAESILEREAQRVLDEAGKGTVSQEAIEDITNKLKGLGYLE